ncbi:hypothetical protein SAMN05428970_2390 [Agromyces sp. CF514]|nr:hypothetical protein SAMN05428970_2390 [Agromyces sp. CF514]
MGIGIGLTFELTIHFLVVRNDGLEVHRLCMLFCSVVPYIHVRSDESNTDNGKRAEIGDVEEETVLGSRSVISARQIERRHYLIS